MASAVLFERQPFDRIVRWRTVANVLSIGFVTGMSLVGASIDGFTTLTYGCVIGIGGTRSTEGGQAALGQEAEVVIEATGNTMAVTKLIAPHVKRVLIANPLQVRAIAHAKVKTDKIDALVVAGDHGNRGTTTSFMKVLSLS